MAAATRHLVSDCVHDRDHRSRRSARRHRGSAAFVGDFSNAAIVLGLPPAVRYTASAIGFGGVAVVLFAAGRTLRRWTPEPPFIVLVNQPTPMGTPFLSARLAEGSFWVFVAVGTLTAPERSTDDERPLAFHPVDALAAVVVTVVVRVMSQGIVLTP